MSGKIQIPSPAWRRGVGDIVHNVVRGEVRHRVHDGVRGKVGMTCTMVFEARFCMAGTMAFTASSCMTLASACAYKTMTRPLTTGKQYFAMCHKNTAKAQLNTAEALPCFDTRQNVHGIYWHGKDICRVYF
jgi:hypothetical protein